MLTWRRTWRLVVLSLLLIGLLVPLVPAPNAAAQTLTDPAAVARLYFGALSRGDLATAADLLSDRVVLATEAASGCHPAACVGKAAVRAELAKWTRPGGRMSVIEVTARGPVVQARVETQTEAMTRAGVQRAVFSIILVVDNGKVAYNNANFDYSDAQTARYVAAANLGRNLPARVPLGDPADIVRRYLEAENRRDVAAATALVHANGVFVTEAAGLCTAAPCLGRDAVRREIERRVQVGQRSTPEGIQVFGPAAIERIEFSSDVVRAAGAQRVVFDRIHVVEEGQIIYQQSVPNLSDAQTARYIAYVRAQPRPAGAPATQAQMPRTMPRTGENGVPIHLGLLGLAAVAVGWRLRRREAVARE